MPIPLITGDPAYLVWIALVYRRLARTTETESKRDLFVAESHRVMALALK